MPEPAAHALVKWASAQPRSKFQSASQKPLAVAATACDTRFAHTASSWEPQRHKRSRTTSVQAACLRNDWTIFRWTKAFIIGALISLATLRSVTRFSTAYLGVGPFSSNHVKSTTDGPLHVPFVQVLRDVHVPPQFAHSDSDLDVSRTLNCSEQAISASQAALSVRGSFHSRGETQSSFL